MALFRARPLSKRLLRLKANPLFSTLDARGLRIVDGALHEREYRAGEVVFDQGEEGQAIYLLFAGRLEILRDGKKLSELGPGSFLGEIALLEGAPRVAKAVASSDCEVGVLFRADFDTLLETDARIASRIALQLARHLGNLIVRNRNEGQGL